MVRRNLDNVNLIMPYKSYDLMRESIDFKSTTPIRKLSLLGECDAKGELIQGNPHLHENDISNIGADPLAVTLNLFGYQVQS